jgi:hypothetical protein
MNSMATQARLWSIRGLHFLRCAIGAGIRRSLGSPSTRSPSTATPPSPREENNSSGSMRS